MCGIVGYIGKEKAFPILLSGLKRVLYRGYDSFGFAVNDSQGNVRCFKKVGKLDEWEQELAGLNLEGNTGIGHSRWGTHGGITENNSHPHWDCQKNVFLVHNGIIENFDILKEQLIREGHIFRSETDTEVLAHLIEKYFEGNLEEAVRRALREVRGTYGLAVVSRKDPKKIVAARLSSPLLFGVSEGGVLLASDPSAIISYTRKMVVMEDNEIAILRSDDFLVLKEKPAIFIDWKPEEYTKEEFPHFMLKEIMEEPEAIRNAIRGRLVKDDGTVKLGGLDEVKESLKKTQRVYLVGCGTAFLAGKVAETMIKEYVQIFSRAEIASEFRYSQPFVNEKTAVFFISQSGETADTLACLKEMKKKGILTLGITNVVGSSQARDTVGGIYTRSGPEIAVASTKAFLGQLAVLAMLTVFLGRQRNMDLVTGKKIISALEQLPSLAAEVLGQASEIEKLAKKYKEFKNFFFIGRKYDFPVALEGALKLKEVSYIHAEGYAGGELKHGPLALIDENFPTIAVCPFSSVYDKTISNIQEIKSRGGPVIAIATRGNKEIRKIADDVVYIPDTLEMLSPLLSVIPLHLFAYYLARELNREIDKPRNLAKSVTVE